MDGDRLALPPHLLDQLMQQAVVFHVGDAKAAALLPEEELFGTGEDGVFEVQFEGPPVGVPVGDGVDDLVAGEAIRMVLDHVPEAEGLVVGQMPSVEVRLDG